MKASYLIELGTPAFSKFLGYSVIKLGEDTEVIRRVAFDENINGAHFFQYKTEALHVYEELLKEIGAENTGRRTLLPALVVSFLENSKLEDVFGLSVTLHALSWKDGHFSTMTSEVIHQHTYVVTPGHDGEPYSIK